YDCKLTYLCKTNEWIFHWVYEKQARIRETQDVIHAISLDFGVKTSFTWYSPTKGAGKIGNHDIGRIYRLCEYMNDLILRKDKLSDSKSKYKKKKASHLDKAKDQKNKQENSEKKLGWSHYKFKQRLISKSEKKGNKVIFQDKAYTSKTCSWCDNMQSIVDQKYTNAKIAILR
ncbi:13986_t:CDS:2, partial [Cetraspora pellucida]